MNKYIRTLLFLLVFLIGSPLPLSAMEVTKTRLESIKEKLTSYQAMVASGAVVGAAALVLISWKLFGKKAAKGSGDQQPDGKSKKGRDSRTSNHESGDGKKKKKKHSSKEDKSKTAAKGEENQSGHASTTDDSRSSIQSTGDDSGNAGIAPRSIQEGESSESATSPSSQPAKLQILPASLAQSGSGTGSRRGVRGVKSIYQQLTKENAQVSASLPPGTSPSSAATPEQTLENLIAALSSPAPELTQQPSRSSAEGRERRKDVKSMRSATLEAWAAEAEAVVITEKTDVDPSDEVGTLRHLMLSPKSSRHVSSEDIALSLAKETELESRRKNAADAIVAGAFNAEPGKKHKKEKKDKTSKSDKEEKQEPASTQSIAVRKASDFMEKLENNDPSLVSEALKDPDIARAFKEVGGLDKRLKNVRELITEIKVLQVELDQLSDQITNKKTHKDQKQTLRTREAELKKSLAEKRATKKKEKKFLKNRIVGCLGTDEVSFPEQNSDN